MKQIILAFSSPRRKELLASIGLKFKVKPSYIEEKLNPRLGPKAQAESLSLQKATIVASKYEDVIVISADTIVVLGSEIIGKPNDAQEAKRFLRKLHGTRHSVITGFTIIDSESGKTITKSVKTNIYMRKLSDKEIETYIKKENVFDKAGAYAIQGIGSIFFEKIEGDYSNVVGLPIYAVAQELKKFGVFILSK